MVRLAMRQSYLCVKQITKKEQIAHLFHLFSRTLIPRTKPVPDLQKSNRSLPSRLPLDIHNSHPLPHAHPIANSHPIHYPYLPPISIEPLTMPQTADNLLSDPEIATAYEDVRSDKSATTWMVLKYISGTSDALKLDSTGEGEISEMVEHLGDDEAAYAFVRMTVGNDELSQRVKFVFVSWCGE